MAYRLIPDNSNIRQYETVAQARLDRQSERRFRGIDLRHFNLKKSSRYQFRIDKLMRDPILLSYELAQIETLRERPVLSSQHGCPLVE